MMYISAEVCFRVSTYFASRLAAMPGYNSTAEYAAAQLRRVGWITRHKLMARLQVRKPKWHDAILAIMTPDEMLDGKDTMPVLPEHSVIVMKSGPPKTKNRLLQTRITKYFRLKRGPMP